MIPPLTISFIDHIQKGKEKLQQKNKNVGSFFSDDGFALGVAYLLKILNLEKKFASLNWFQSIFDKMNREMKHADQRDKTLDQNEN